MTSRELEDLARNALTQAEADDAEARQAAEYQRLNAEAIRLHALGYPYCGAPTVKYPEAGNEPEHLLRRTRALRDQVRTRGLRGAAATESLYVAADLERELKRLMAEWLIDEAVIIEMNELLAELGAIPGQ